MRNWSKYYRWNPDLIEYPKSEQDIQQLIQTAIQKSRNIRVIGSGHSFNPLWVTSDIQVSLDHYQGLVKIDENTFEATFKAGTKLHQLTRILHEHGWALENMGDINRQSIAGAISTGTHGTGTRFRNMSSQVEALKFVNGKGEIINCSREKHPEIFKCCQISLGALGIITEVTLKCVPQFKLELIVDKTHLDEVIESFNHINASNRNFEFYWFPNTDQVMTKISNKTEDLTNKNPLARIWQDYVLENVAYQLLCEYGALFPRRANSISRFSAKTISHSRKTDYSHKVFTTPRWVRFNEMEYNVPVEVFEDVVKDLTQWINRNNRSIHFPLEFRFVKGDDIFLSPSYQRDSAYIACHVYHKKECKQYFRELEKIFLNYDGRPHWGKMHTQQAEDLEAKYPKFKKFISIMENHDPGQIFLNDYLRKMLYGA